MCRQRPGPSVEERPPGAALQRPWLWTGLLVLGLNRSSPAPNHHKTVDESGQRSERLPSPHSGTGISLGGGPRQGLGRVVWVPGCIVAILSGRQQTLPPLVTRRGFELAGKGRLRVRPGQPISMSTHRAKSPTGH